MKVCVIGTRGFPMIEGGVEKHCEMLYPLLDKGIEVIAFRRKPYVKCKDSKYTNIVFTDLPSTRIKGFETVFHSLISTIRAIMIHPDVIHYHNIGPAMFSPIAKLFRIPVVLTYHSPNYEHKKWGCIAKRILKMSEGIALRNSVKIIFVNKYQMDKFPESIRKKSQYIPNGIQEPIETIRTDYLEEIGVKPNKYVLSVGRITPEKGFDTLVKGFKNAEVCEYQLVIAGGVEFENAYMKELKKLCENVTVVFTGYVHGEPLAQLYRNAALFILASDNEGFPLVLLEAMSYELDVLVSDISATRLVKLREEDYFERGNITELSKKICERLNQTSMNRIRREYDLHEYDWKQIAKRVSEIYEEIK